MSRLSYLLPVVAIACSESAASRPAELAPAPAGVRTATVVAEAAATPDVVTLTGKIVADQRAEVTADTQGKVLAVMVERGQRVVKGQPVVQLDVRGASLSTAEASAQLAAARSEQALADRECERTQRLLAQGAIARAEWDRDAARCASAAQQVAAASARRSMLAKTVQDGMVRAPFDGVVADRAVTPGEWVTPGRALFTLVDTAPLKVEVSVSEAHVAELALGQRVELATVARPGRRFGATVSRIGAEIGRSRSLIAEAIVDDAAAEHLVPGMFVSAGIVVGQVTRPTLPATAVALRGKVWHAFIVDKAGVITDRIVELGPAPAPGRVSIVQNLTAGDRVVAAITPQITDGLRVE